MKHEEREVRQIYNDYGDDLYRLCYFYTGNVHDAMDAVQNTLVHLRSEERRVGKHWYI